MTNNERFNAMLNGYQHPRTLYNALHALAPLIRETRPAFPESEALAELKRRDKDDAAYVIVQG